MWYGPVRMPGDTSFFKKARTPRAVSLVTTEDGSLDDITSTGLLELALGGTGT
jgi:hypothetical protein